LGFGRQVRRRRKSLPAPPSGGQGDEKAKADEKKAKPKSGDAKSDKPDKKDKPGEAKTSEPRSESKSESRANIERI